MLRMVPFGESHIFFNLNSKGSEKSFSNYPNRSAKSEPKAETKAQTFNSFFVWGDCGTLDTHIMF